MISKAKQLTNQVNFKVANATKLPFNDNQFDVVISSSLINIIDDKQTAIKELKRVCKPNGTISILVPNKNFNQYNFMQLSSSLRLSGFSAAVLKRWNKSAPKMDKDTLLALFNNANLKRLNTKNYLDGMVITLSTKK